MKKITIFELRKTQRMRSTVTAIDFLFYTWGFVSTKKRLVKGHTSLQEPIVEIVVNFPARKG